jgi:hypothetical protein
LRLVDAPSSGWMAEVERELCDPFDWRRRPLARFVWVRSSDDPQLSWLVGAGHHLVGDSTSVAITYGAIFEKLSQPDAVASPGTLPLTPTDIVSLEQQEELVRSATPDQEWPALAAPVEQHLPSARVMTWELPPAATGRLLARCRSEQTTAHGALCAAFVEALPDRRSGADRRRVRTAYNLRGRMPGLEPDAFGLFMIVREAEVAGSPERDPWETARRWRAAVSEGEEPKKLLGPYFQRERIIAAMDDRFLRSFVEQALAVPDRCDLAVSNTGRWPLPRRIGDLEIEAGYGFVAGTSTERVLVVTNLNDTLCFALTWRDFSLTVREAESFREQGMKTLETMST